MRNLTALIDQQEQIVAAREQMLAVAMERQRRGLVPEADVLVQRGMKLDEQMRLLKLHAQRRDADVALIRALGGGFEANQTGAAASPVQPSNVDPHENPRDNRASINPPSS
jgi:outer membrane protein TolC